MGCGRGIFGGFGDGGFIWIIVIIFIFFCICDD